MTMREWLAERAAKDQRLLSFNGSVYGGTVGAIVLLDRARFVPAFNRELDAEVEEVTLKEMYAEYGYIGHVGRTKALCFTYLTSDVQEPLNGEA